MALIKCKECGREISDKASVCPHCGCPVELDDAGQESEFDDTEQEGMAEEEPKKRKVWFWLLPLIIVLIGGAFLAYQTMSHGDSSGDGADSVNIKPMYTCTIYADNNGELRDGAGVRICALNVYSRGEPLSIYLSSEVSWGGMDLEHVYLKAGKVYDEFPFSYSDKELTPIATYEMETIGSDVNITFYPLSSGGASEQVAKTKSAEKKIQKASTTDEVRQLINGTTWHYTENLSNSQIGCWLKVEFKDGQYTSYYAQPDDGKWTKDQSGSFEIKEGRYSNTGERYISVCYDGNIVLPQIGTTIPCKIQITTDNFQLNVQSNYLTMLDRMSGGSGVGHHMNLTGTMKYGDYSWN